MIHYEMCSVEQFFKSFLGFCINLPMYLYQFLPMMPASVFFFLVLITKVVAWAAVMADEGVAAKTVG